MKNYTVYTGHLNENTEETTIKFLHRLGWSPRQVEGRNSDWILTMQDSDYEFLMLLDESEIIEIT